MAETAAKPRQPERVSAEDAAAETAVLAAITVVMLSGAPAPVATPGLVALLAPFGIPAAAVTAAVGLVLPHVVPPSAVEARRFGAVGWAERTEPARHAAYLLSAGRRIAERAGYQVARPGITLDERAELIARAITPDDIDRERVNLQRHLDAARLRREAATRVDAEAALRGPLLGWHATLDSRTTSECRAAHGNNFRVDRPPQIGYPGMPHGGTCRCRPGVPHPSRLTVDQAVAGVPVH